MNHLDFVDEYGSFAIHKPENISYLYFPLAAETGLKSSITPNLGGDAKIDQETFLLEPVSAENLHNNRAVRNFWLVDEDGQVFSAAGASAEQEAALSNYQNHREERMRETEELLLAYGGKDCPTRFFPRTLLFERNGEYALLCDDKENPDDGVAVVLFPKQKVILQDDYL